MGKSRREYGDGSIYRRESDGRYVASLRMENGRRKYFYSSIAQTNEGKARAEVKAQLEKFKRDLEAGIAATAASKQTVAQYLDFWLEVKKATIEESTLVSMRYHLLCVRPHIGHIKLVKLTPAQIQAMYARLQERYAPNTIRLLHTSLSSAFKDAIAWEHLSRNPCKGVKPPKAEKAEIVALTAEQASALMQTASGTPLECMIMVAVTTGMREGELFGLKWADVDLEKKRLQVKRTAVYLTEKNAARHIETDPKSASSKRQIVLPAFVADALKAHRARQREQRIRAKEWSEQGLVFPNRKGGHYYVNTLYRQFLPMLSRAGLPRMRFHDLRHSAATILLAQGVHPKIVQELLGHSSIQITLNTYSHIIPTMQQTVMDNLDVLYSGIEPKNERFS